MTWRKTTDHNEILGWVSNHGGQPSAIRTRDGTLGIVRLQFQHPEQMAPSTNAPPLEPISWDEFFEQFEQRKLALVYENELDDAAAEASAKLVSRRAFS
jgi:hypothetical protein